MQRKVNETRNNVFDTNEILWLLEGNEKLTAFEFVCRYILGVEPEHISDVLETADQPKPHTFLVQELIKGELFVSIYTENELISYINLFDCNNGKHRIFDISVLGEAMEVFYRGWQPDCLIEVADRDGNIILSGYGTCH